MNNNLVNFNCKIPAMIKDILQKQSKQEGIPMSIIAQELIEFGLMQRIKHKEGIKNKFLEIQNLDNKSIGFLEY